MQLNCITSTRVLGLGLPVLPVYRLFFQNGITDTTVQHRYITNNIRENHE